MGIFTLIQAIYNLITLPFKIAYIIKNREKIIRRTNIVLNIIIAILLFAFVIVIIKNFNPFVFLAAFLIQFAIVYKVDRMMKSQTGDQGLETLPELETQEVLSPSVPAFVKPSIYDSNSWKAGEAFVKRVQADFNKRVGIDALLGAVSIILSYFSSAFTFKINGFVLMTGGALLTNAFIQWLFLRKQYRPADAQFEGILGRNPIIVYGRELARLLQKALLIFSILIGLIIIYGIFVSISEKDYLGSAILATLGGIHFYRIIRSQPKNDYNIKLLLLRTFDFNENSLFTFGRLIPYWEKVGNYFTVVDTTYLKHKYRFKSQRTIVVFIILQWLALLVQTGMQRVFPELGNIQILFFFLTATFATTIIIASEYYMINRGFIKSRDDVQLRLKHIALHPHQIDQSFKGLPTMCHANTWRGTVAELVKITDIVMMDLRGFSEAKKGCEYEIDFLLDNIAVNRIVFLVSSKDKEAFIHNTILERWKYLRTHSPNLEAKTPQIQIYQISSEKEYDVQGIFDYLLYVASNSGRAAGIAAL